MKKLKELAGATICVAQGTTHEFNMASWFRAAQSPIKTVVFESQDVMYDAFFGGRCDAMTQDASALASALATRGKQDGYTILAERISKEPLGPFVRHGDDVWLDVVRWSLYALLEAEERGITQANVDAQLKSPDALVQRLLGVTPGNGKALGLEENWAYNIIKQIGNYGESYERNVGKGSPLKLAARPQRAVDRGRADVPAAAALAGSVRASGGRAARPPHRRGVRRAAAAAPDGGALHARPARRRGAAVDARAGASRRRAAGHHDAARQAPRARRL